VTCWMRFGDPVSGMPARGRLKADHRSAGAAAFSRTGDPSTGDFGDASVIRKFGDVPSDLSRCKAEARSQPNVPD
jgi:hypothetical protein